MSRFIKWLQNEIREVLPSVLFFFVAFNPLRWTSGLILKEHGIQVGSFVAA